MHTLSWGMLRLTLLKLFFIAAFLVMVNFTCPEVGCKASFPTIRGLNQHRQSCIYSQDDSSFLDGDAALARLNEKRARKRQKLNPPDENQASSSTSVEHSGLGMSQVDLFICSLFYFQVELMNSIDVCCSFRLEPTVRTHGYRRFGPRTCTGRCS